MSVTSVVDQLDALVVETGGILRTRDAQGIASRPTISRYVKQRGLQRLSAGVYVTPDAWLDEMWLLSLRIGDGVFSHHSALYLLDFTDREPAQLTLTVPSGYNATTLNKEGIKTYFIRRDLISLGKMSVNTYDGHPVACYDLERTVCDIYRSRADFEPSLVISVLQSYVRNRNRNLTRLAQYSQKLGVSRRLMEDIEVLL